MRTMWEANSTGLGRTVGMLQHTGEGHPRLYAVNSNLTRGVTMGIKIEGKWFTVELMTKADIRPRNMIIGFPQIAIAVGDSFVYLVMSKIRHGSFSGGYIELAQLILETLSKLGDVTTTAEELDAAFRYVTTFTPTSNSKSHGGRAYNILPQFGISAVFHQNYSHGLMKSSQTTDYVELDSDDAVIGCVCHHPLLLGGVGSEAILKVSDYVPHFLDVLEDLFDNQFPNFTVFYGVYRMRFAEDLPSYTGFANEPVKLKRNPDIGPGVPRCSTKPRLTTPVASINLN